MTWQLMRWFALLVASLLSAVSSLAATEDDYPNRMIKIVVPLPAGGLPDVVTRIVADKLAARWRQPVVIENRPGAALNLGAEAVANAAPDGYTLLSTPPGPLVTNQYLYSKLRFEAEAFVPISVVVKFPFILIVHPKVPASTLPELIAYAKANPHKLNFASSGFGAPPHLAGELLQAKAGIRFTHVPYKGLEPALQDLLAGQVDTMFYVVGDTLAHIKSGSLRALGVGDQARVPELPDVPAISEILAGFVATTWVAIVAPPKTPSEISAKLSRAIAEIVQLPDVAKRLRDFAAAPAPASPAETAEFFKQERERWRDVIASAGIKPR
jgi:tripartite-type tricarboxylate transporter receptor subunit TctC